MDEALGTPAMATGSAGTGKYNMRLLGQRNGRLTAHAVQYTHAQRFTEQRRNRSSGNTARRLCSQLHALPVVTATLNTLQNTLFLASATTASDHAGIRL